MRDEQLAFDIEGMLHEAQLDGSPEWTGAPLHFTTAYYAPNDLDAAFEHWQSMHAHAAPHANSRMWRRSITVPENSQFVDHGFVLYTADLRCEPWKHADGHNRCTCVGELMYQSICEQCVWSSITDSENDAVEMWHDHALPGWRDLPIVPSRLRQMDQDKLSKVATRWIFEHYPKSMQVPGAPIITERRPYGTRHVPNRSPWGGYDLSHTALEPNRLVEGSKPLRQTPDLAPGGSRTASPAGLGLGD